MGMLISVGQAMDDPLDEDMPGDSGPSVDRVKAAVSSQDQWGNGEMIGYWATMHQIGRSISKKISTQLLNWHFMGVLCSHFQAFKDTKYQFWEGHAA